MLRPVIFLTLLLFGAVSFLWGQGWREMSDALHDNTSGLKMHVYSPSGVTPFSPMVVLMHGCRQDARVFAQRSGWVDMAGRAGFHLLCPEQQTRNNAQRCFNWFLPYHIRAYNGEVHAIAQMIDWAKRELSVDNNRIFLVGFSAGGAMAMAMMSVYPGIFKGGAVFAAVPYGAARTPREAMQVMNRAKNRSQAMWADDVLRAGKGRAGRYPPLMVVHGNDDRVVDPANSEAIIKQWTGVHQTDTIPDKVQHPYRGNSRIKKRVYETEPYEIGVVAFKVDFLRHAYPVYPGHLFDRGGTKGQFFQDVEWWGTVEAARFFELVLE